MNIPKINEIGDYKEDFSTPTTKIYDHKYNPYYLFIFPQEKVDLSSKEKRNTYLNNLGFVAEFSLTLPNGLLVFKIRRLEETVMQ